MVLLTGASGFVGSHILQELCAQNIPTALLLRPESSHRFISPYLSKVEKRLGSILEPASLPPGLVGISHVIHCAGATRARRSSDFFAVNRDGTRHLVEAVNESSAVKRFLLISSLAASGPSAQGRMRREEDSPQPISDYGRSKLAGELEVRDHCRASYVILRPPAVYGPHDTEFLRLFRAVRHRLRPEPLARQELSLVFVKDLARAVVFCLDSPAASRKTYFVAADEVLTANDMAREIATQLASWTVPLPLPASLLWLVCLAQEVRTRLTGKANVLSLQKFAELRAPAWTCDPSRIATETGWNCPTRFREGAAQTLAWYREQSWL